MTPMALNNSNAKSKVKKITEFFLLALCLSVLAVRATYTESPNIASSNPALDVRADFYSLCISGVLIFAVLVWFVRGLFKKASTFRFSGMVVGLVVFAAAAVSSIGAAANVRAAITDFATLLAPMLMAVLLVQILDSHLKVKLVLYIVAALGAVNAYQCADQFFSSNKVNVQQYEENPAAMLGKLGIEAGSYRQMLFERRLYSKGVHGFFLTGNSAGSFALMTCFVAAALLIENLSNNSRGPGRIRLLLTAVVTVFVLFGLVLTRSKGAIAAAVLSALMFAAYLLFAGRLKAHKKAIFVLCLLLLVLVVVVVGGLGLSHGRLPGGKSMLVRWQYWAGAGKMYADHPFTGVGGGNFSEFYPRYKVPAAPETVRDPHNFVLSLLTQYGPLGLIGFLAAIFIGLYKTIFGSNNNSIRPNRISESSFFFSACFLMVVCAAVLLIVRPMLIPAKFGDEPFAVVFSVILLLYFSPVMIFAVAFVFLSFKEQTTRFNDTTRAAIFCAIIGVLVHNCVDFAIFEPGVLTTLWALVACLIALGWPRTGRALNIGKVRLRRKLPALAIALVAAWAYFTYVLLPVERSTRAINQAKETAAQGWLDYAHYQLSEASAADPLSPSAAYLNGRFYLQQYHGTKAIISAEEARKLLLSAEDSLMIAMHRNNANFKTFERLAEVYAGIAAGSDEEEKKGWLGNAYVSAYEAVERYPGCGRLRLVLASIAEQLGKTDVALEEFRSTVEIEDAYREQFREMFPGREIFSRLGEQNYQFAKDRIKTLTAESAEKSKLSD